MACMPYVISAINLIIDDVSYGVANVYAEEVQEKFFSISLSGKIDIAGLGILKVDLVSIVFDREMMDRFPGREFRKYNIKCKITDKAGA